MAQTQPNVIWVLTDQQRAMMLSCNGDPNVHTPNIDALADMGVNFTRAVSGYPLCCPFRGSMLTSRYPHECVPGHEYQMPPAAGIRDGLPDGPPSGAPGGARRGKDPVFRGAVRAAAARPLSRAAGVHGAL